jgi:N-acetylneuraminic acid mutarotase
VEPLPVAVSNNAVASVRAGDRQLAYSMMGIGSSLAWDAITTRAFELDLVSGAWREIASVPGETGRIAATAAGVNGRVYLFGGYTVAPDGEEVSLANVDVYDPVSGSWSRGMDMPVPVDDTVSGIYRRRWIYLVSGWSMTDNVADVQVYDTVEDRWLSATPIPGTPVFGHAGGLFGDTIVYCDGAFKGPEGTKPRYRATDECWQGRIDEDDLTDVEWSRIEPHPGASRYRAAAGASEADGRIYFSGGTDNPYNIDGIGYDGVPSEPVPLTFARDIDDESWVIVDDAPRAPTMDHRGLLFIDATRLVIGGMERGQSVTRRVRVER